jgi:hypothetical protein
MALLPRKTQIVNDILGETLPTDGGVTTGMSHLPDEWNEAFLTRQLSSLSGKPLAVVTYTIDQMLGRWVTGQDHKTAPVRMNFIKTKSEELKLVKEGRTLMVDLEALALEREKRLKTLQLENARLDDTLRTQGEQERLIALKERKQVELEIAQIEKQIADLNREPDAPRDRKLSVEEQIDEQQAHLQRLEKERDEELAEILKGRQYEQLAPKEKDIYQLADNSWEEKIESEREKLRTLKQRRRAQK